MKVFTKLLLLGMVCAPSVADALEYNSGKFAFKLTGYGTAGLIEPDFETPVFVGDWRVRGQMNYAINDIYTFGAVYALDANAVEEDKFMREAFVSLDNKNYGRVELGFTDSIARKLGLGLPDVGGLRINDKPLFHKKIIPDGPVISDTIISTGRSALRMNLATKSINGNQYGVSVAGLTDDYNWALDAGLKLRRPSGKVKTAFSLGASFMDNPDNYSNDVYTPNVTADWRAQIDAGMNLQYNSWVWGVSGRLVYDENPIGPISDGLVVGTGVSYDLLKYSVSLTYMFSDTGIWRQEVEDFLDHMVIGSFRYKYSANVDGWMSLGITSKTPFISAGMRLTF